jgi:ABC-2 type transport system ATP-binding protein
MANSESIIIDNLTKTFNSYPAINDLSFQVKRNEMFIIVGPDGSGKTTLLRILAGILSFDSGNVRIFENALPRQAEKAKLIMGYMPQRFGLYEDLTVQENLDFFYDLYCLPRKNRREAYEKMYAFSGLERFKKRLAGKLSGGMKQKLGLGCVLLHKPSLLLLDEPTNGVDPYSRRTFWNILSEFKKQGVTIIVATPFMDEAERGDRVLLMMEGRKLASGTPAEIKGLWDGVLYQAYSPDSRKAKSLLDASGLVKTSVLFGNKLHFVPLSEEKIDEIRTLLQKENVLTGDLQQIEPELEDLFISLVTNE